MIRCWASSRRIVSLSWGVMVRRPRVPDYVTMRLASSSSLEANQSMPRYKLILEYDGTPFVGWQRQENGASVQGRLADAIRSFSGEEAVPRGAGRTDAGVHALGQVAHFDLAKDWADD